MNDKVHKRSMEFPELATALKTLIQDFVHSHSLVAHHIDSYNHFISHIVPNILEELGNFTVAIKTGGRHNIIFSNPVFEPPTVRNSDFRLYPLWPSEALQRRLTYALGFYTDIVHRLYDAAGNVVFCRSYSHFMLCAIPCMIGSSFCYLRQRQPELFQSPEKMVGYPTGYFIVSGQEKILISQEAMRTNWPCCTLYAPDTDHRHARLELRALNTEKWRSTSTLNIYLSRNHRKGLSLMVAVPFLTMPVNAYIVFLALGIETVETIIDLCCDSDRVDDSDRPFLEKLISAQAASFAAITTVPPSKISALDYIAHQHGKIATSSNCSDSTGDADVAIDVLDIEAPAIGSEGVDEGADEGADEELLPAVAPQQAQQLPEITTPLKTAFRQVSHIFDVEVFPHLGFDESCAINKARFLGVCVAKIIRVFEGKQEPDDRDEYTNKRIQPAGVLLAVLFRQLIRRMLNQLALHLGKIPSDRIQFEHIINFCEFKQLTTSLRYSLATGNWGILKAGCSVVGVSQPLFRDSRTGTLSHGRRFSSGLNRDGKQSKPRQLYPKHYGVVCPCETPEGKSSGLVKALALLAVTQISISAPVLIKQLYRYISPPLLIPIGLSPLVLHNYVFVNGIIIGITQDPTAFCARARCLKRLGFVPRFISVSHNDCGVHVNCDAGTLTRPIFYLQALWAFMQEHPDYVKRFSLPGIWKHLMKRGVIVFIDKAEDAHLQLAPNVLLCGAVHRDYEYAEIHPSTFMGLLANMIPFSPHNQAPRNIYSACMGKQATGIPHLDFLERVDPTTYVLGYPQRPIVETLGDAVACMDVMPGGCNAVVLIATYQGWNMEDAIIFNRASVDRGLYNLNIFRTYSDEIMNNTADAQKFCPPNLSVTQAIRAESYERLDPEDGLLYPGMHVRHGDPIIGKVITLDSALGNGASDKQQMDRSTIAKHQHDTAVVHSCAITTTPNNNRLAHVTTVSQRIVSVGDKFASRHAQKGVCSVLVDPENLPFSSIDGMIPDIIISPHAIPSRMTMAQLLESLLGKYSALNGKISDATAFVKQDFESVKQALRSQGFKDSGKQRFINGITGEEMEGELFMGIVYYNRLKHMVKDKLHARAKGPVHDLTRQPPHGRGRNGGFRLGEMERDAMIAHGVAAFLNDRYVKNSDEFKTVYCKLCGQFATPARPYDAKYSFDAQEAHCRLCNSSDNVVPIVLPYCMKLLIQELQGMNIYTKLFPQ
ncbi:MAG: hypothetical protein WCO71_00420 [Pseudomonadota bacterium]